ncbi:hypothetical protein RclHR1_08740005 [Rhizophagus clarus]|uniref:Uncharacterized protein n=1 Tax=Rhizophagus clarus TaxID=94130 RepID=A0A2Z6SCR8_9GLOM|nr:hypothetical protein RclHR1_08740005 [Rhizophagus clarus]
MYPLTSLTSQFMLSSLLITIAELKHNLIFFSLSATFTSMSCIMIYIGKILQSSHHKPYFKLQFYIYRDEEF